MYVMWETDLGESGTVSYTISRDSYGMTEHDYNQLSESEVAIVINVLEDWFWANEKDTAQYRLPRLHLPRCSEEEVDKMISRIDGLIHAEIKSTPHYFAARGMETKGKRIDFGTRYYDLKGACREAFVQDVKAAKEEMVKVYHERVNQEQQERDV